MVICLGFIIIFIIFGFSDPGLIKRNETNKTLHNKKIKFVHKGNYLKTKICNICKITKPLRSNHCSICNNCVLHFDHHSNWIGNCVGKGNYFLSFLSLIFINGNCIFIFVFSLIQFIDNLKNIDSEINKEYYFIHLLGTSIVNVLVLCILFFSIKYFIVNLKLIFNNLTYYENTNQILNSQIGNIYNKGIGNNIKEFLGRKLPEYNVLKELSENEKEIKEKDSYNYRENNNYNEYNKVNERSNISDNKNNSATDIMSNKKNNNVTIKPNKNEIDNEKNSNSSRRDLKSIDINDLNSFISIPKENSLSVDEPKENSFDDKL